MKNHIRRGASIAAAAMMTCGIVPVATAAEIAPGAPMKIANHEEVPIPGLPEEFTAGACSQGIPGTVVLPDGTTKQVMVSAGHCVWGIDEPNAGPEVYVPTYTGDQQVGVSDQGGVVYDIGFDGEPLHEEVHTMVNGPDWGTVGLLPGVSTTRMADSVDQFGNSHGDPVTLTGVRDYRDLQPWEVTVDNFGQPICKDGQTSGRSCGVQLFRTQNGLWSYGMAYQGGDSGGVNFDPNTGEALGVTSMSLMGLDRAQPADVALQNAYGIPDGQVNDRFTLPESTEPADEFRTLQDDEQAATEWIEQHPEALPEDPFVPLDSAIEDAEADANAIVGDVQNDLAAVGESFPDPVASQQSLAQAQQTVEDGIATMTDHAQNIQAEAEVLFG